MIQRIILLDLFALIGQIAFVGLNFILAGFAIRNHHYTFYYLFIGLASIGVMIYASYLLRSNQHSLPLYAKVVHTLITWLVIIGFTAGVFLTGWLIYLIS